MPEARDGLRRKVVVLAVKVLERGYDEGIESLNCAQDCATLVLGEGVAVARVARRLRYKTIQSLCSGVNGL